MIDRALAYIGSLFNDRRFIAALFVRTRAYTSVFELDNLPFSRFVLWPVLWQKKVSLSLSTRNRQILSLQLSLSEFLRNPKLGFQS